MRENVLRSFLVLGLFAAACGDDGGLPPPAQCQQGAFVGDWRIGRADADGSFVGEELVDLSEVGVSAVVETETGPVTYAGVGFLGGFSIAGVPHTGPKTVRLDFPDETPWFRRTEDCRWDRYGWSLDPKVTYAASGTTGLELSVDGLFPWNLGDELELDVPGIADSFWLSAPTPGATSGAGLRDDDSRWPLLEPANATPGTVYQRSQQPLADGSDAVLMTIAAAGDIAPFSLREGMIAPAEAHLEPLESNRDLSLEIDGLAFADAARAARLDPWDELWISIRPGGWGCVRPRADVVSITAPLTGTTVLDAEPYADPFDGDRRRVCLSYLATTPARTFEAEFSEVHRLDSIESTSMGPSVFAPTAWMVGGQDAYTPGSPVGLTPEVTWAAPAETYLSQVTVTRVTTTVVGNSTTRLSEPIATIDVESPLSSLALPGGLLELDQTYALLLIAAQPAGTARVHSGMFTP